MAQAGGSLAGSSSVGKLFLGRELGRRKPCVLASRGKGGQKCSGLYDPEHG